MLQHTFVHLSGIGERAERSLWKQGCRHWDDFLAEPNRFRLGSASREMVRNELKSSLQALEQGHHQFFRRRLKQKHAWRAFDTYRDSCVFLDIETDGGTGPDSVTVIGLYDGKEFIALVRGDNLESFRDLISHYSLIVTFYGTGFDLPVLKRRFPGVSLDQIHIDLCPLFRSLDIRGGLKKIEKHFDLARSETTDGLNGYDAILLWRRFQKGEESALQTLIEYNREDVVNLLPLTEIACQRMRETLPYLDETS